MHRGHSCRAITTPYTKAHEPPREAVQKDQKDCYERPLCGQLALVPIVREAMAAGQGFEPQLPGPEPGVLPLDDPATAVAV